MELRNFEFTKDNIGIQFEGSYFDLHNCADFLGLEYSIVHRNITLSWRKNSQFASPSFPTEISIIIGGLVNLHIKSRDPEMPFTEDTCVKYIGFHPNEEWESSEEIEYSDSHLPTPNSHLILNFQSGASVRLIAENASLAVKK